MLFVTRKSTVCLIVLTLICGCSSVPAPQTVDHLDSGQSTLPVDLQLHWVRTAAEYHATLFQAYAVAKEQITRFAGEHRASHGDQPWAVVLDADETVIDNSLYQVEQLRLGKGYDRDSWQAWVARREAPPLPGVMDFLDHVRELGGTIAIVTNRRDHECPDTRANFDKYSIPRDVILCRTAEGTKDARWAMVENGSAKDGLPAARILMWIGDNIMDFPGVDQSTRAQGADGYAKFGERLIIVPNPMYGSWEENPRS